jgi:hypothetical protein
MPVMPLMLCRSTDRLTNNHRIKWPLNWGHYLKGLKMKEGMSEDFGDSYYAQVTQGDIISKLGPLLTAGGYKIRVEDGKLCAVVQGIGPDTPWHHVVTDDFLDCQTWHRIMFDFFSRKMPAGHQWVPSSCQNCWKVVVRPKTLLGLFALMHLQMRLDRPSKCGIEIRDSVHGLYGGYFYNHSLEEGLDCYSLVRHEVDKTDHLGPDVIVLLKRACTEYEQLVGPSDKWVVTPAQIAAETLVNKWVVRDSTLLTQPTHCIANVHKKWIEYAYKHGDGTYLNFTGGVPLYKPYVTYHHLVDAPKGKRDAAIKKFSRVKPHSYDL